MKNKIMIKSKFSGWHEIGKEKALAYARWKIRAITTCKNDLERLAIINKNLKGIQFELKEVI